MKIQYSATALSTGGRDGQVKVRDSALSLEMATPAELGGKKPGGVNPEQLFAAGYAACFGSAVQHVLRLRKLALAPPDVAVTVGIGRNDAGGFALAADIVVTLAGTDLETAADIVKEAHTVCPYSNATRGNMEVNVTAQVK